jgi:hypothetical protein
MMAVQPKAPGGGDQKSDHRVIEKPGGPPTLAAVGIDKNLAKPERTYRAPRPPADPAQPFGIIGEFRRSGFRGE